jgi:hypothetical protein
MDECRRGRRIILWLEKARSGELELHHSPPSLTCNLWSKFSSESLSPQLFKIFQF